MRYANGSESVLSNGPFAQLLAIRECPCPDGKRRIAYITGQPALAWTIPARIKCRGKWVSGYVSADAEGYEFRANRWGKNYLAGLPSKPTLLQAATPTGTIVMLTTDRAYCVGDTAYLVRWDDGRKPQHARVWPVAWINDRWTMLSWGEMQVDWLRHCVVVGAYSA